MITAKDLKNLLPEFIAYLNQTNSSRSTVKNYSSDLRRLLEKLPADLPIDSSHLDQSLDVLRTEFSEATIRRFSYSLKAFTLWLNTKGFEFTRPAVIPVPTPNTIKVSPIESYVEHIKAEGAPEKTAKLYGADLNNFFTWLKPAGTGINQRIINRVSRFDINRYTSFLRSKQASTSTINRYLYSLKDFFNYHKADIVYETNPVTIEKSNLVNKGGFFQKLKNRIKKPRWWHAYRGHPISDYINYAALAAITLFIGLGLYQQLFVPKPTPAVNLSQLQKGLVLAATPPRILSFQGRLTSNTGTPIVAATNVVFNIYTVRTGGSTSWTSKTWSVTPDQNGIFSVCLGGQDTSDDCLINGVADTVIPASLFSDNAALYLGVTIGGDAEASPRQRIASSTYALNSDSLDGIDSTGFVQLQPAAAQANTGSTTLIHLDETGGSTPDLIDLKVATVSQFKVTNGGNVTLTGTVNTNTFTGSALTFGTANATVSTTGTLGITGGSTLTLNSTTSSAITLDSGTTGTVNIGTNNNAKTINVGTGTAGNTVNIGTNNTTLDTINIGSALDDVAITGDQWSVTNAGVLSAISGTFTGTSSLTLGTASTNTGSVILNNGTNANTVTIQSGTTSTSYSLTLPTAQSSGTQFLQNNGSGVLSWASAAGGVNWDAIGDPSGAGAINFGETVQTLDYTITSANSSLFSFNFTNSGGGAGTDSGVVINNAVSTNTTGDLNTENLLLLQQLDTTATGTTVVDNGIKIDAAANSGITNGIQVTNSAGNIADGILVADTGGGTIGNGIELTGTFTNLISATNFSVNNAGAISAATSSNTINSLIINAGALSGITTLSLNNQLTSTLATGTAPFVVASTTNVANLNASSLNGATFAAPGSIGSGTPGSGAFTTLTSSGATTLGTGSSLTNTFGSGASSVNTIGSVTTPGALTLHGATTLDNTFTISGSNLATLGGNLAVNGGTITSTGSLTLDATSTTIIPDADTFQTNDVTSTGALSLVSGTDTNINISPAGTGDIVFSTDTDSNIQASAQITSTNSLDLISLSFDNRTSSGTQRGLVITQSDNAGFGGTTESFISLIDNSSSGGAPVADGILITSLLNNNITDAIDVSAANLNNALNVGANNIVGTTAVIDFTNFDLSSTGLISGADLTLGLNDTSATISTQDTDENLTIDPNGTGTIFFHGATYGITSTGALTVASCSGCGGGGANTALSNLASVAINLSLLPGANDSIDLGDDTHRWANLFLGGETLHIGTSSSDEAVLSYTTSSNTTLLDNIAAGIINIGTGANTQTITIGNSTGGALRLGQNGSTVQIDGTNYDVSTAGATTVVSPTTFATSGGTIFGQTFAASSTQGGVLTGLSLNFSTNLTTVNSASGNQTGISLTLKDGGSSAATTGISLGGLLDTGITITGLSANSSTGLSIGSGSQTGVVTTGITVGGTSDGEDVTTGYKYTLSGTFAGSAFNSVGTDGYLANIDCNVCGGGAVTTLTNGFHLVANAAQTTVTNGIRFETTNSGVITNGINFTGATGIVTDLILQNGESIDNNVDGTIALGTTTTLTATGALTLSSGGSSGLTLDSASGRTTIATGDFLNLGVSGVSGAAVGDIWYDTAAGKFKINETTGGTKILCNTTDAGCGAGGSTRLDQIGAATASPAAIDSTNFGQTWNWSTLTTQRALTLNSTATGLTTGGIFGLGDASTAYNHGAAEIGSLDSITFKDTTSGAFASTTNGLLVSPTININAGAATKTINGISVNPTFSLCTTATCNVNGVNIANVTDSGNFYGSAINIGTGWDNILLGSLANLTSASATGISITNGSTTTSGTATSLSSTLASAGASTTQNGLLITPPSSTGAGITNGINILGITTPNSSGSETAIKIEGGGWDSILSSPFGGFGRFENKIKYTEDFGATGFGATVWTPTNITYSANSTTAPDNSSNADTLTPTTAATGNVEQQYNFGASLNATTWTFSVWLKAGTAATSKIEIRDFTAGTSCGSSTPSAASTWQRYSVTCTFGGTNQIVAVRIYPDNSNSTGSVIAWGAQLEANGSPSVYTMISNGISSIAQNGPSLNGYFHSSGNAQIGSGSSSMGVPGLAGNWVGLNLVPVLGSFFGVTYGQLTSVNLTASTTTLDSLRIDNPTLLNSSTITTNVGVHILNQTSGTTDYAILIDGADTAGICFDCDGTYSTTTVGAGISWGTDNAAQIYRGSSNSLELLTNGNGNINFTPNGSGVFNITSSATTTNAFALTANSLGTGGKGIVVNSSATAFTGALEEITLSGSASANTGNLLKLSNTGTSNANVSFYIDHRATGTGNMALRIDDSSGDTTPIIVDGDGRLGIGTATITGTTERLLQVGSTTNRGNSATYGEVITKGNTLITSLTNIKDTFIYDTSTDSDGGRWIDWPSTRSLSWYTETLDDSASSACNISSMDRCYAANFPRKAYLVVTTDALYIFDATNGNMWMKFSQNASGYALGVDTNNDPSSVTAANGVIYVGTNGSAAGGLYAFDFLGDRMWNIDGTDRSGADLGIGSRNSAITYNSDNNTNFDIATVGTVADWGKINDVSVTVIKNSGSAIAAATGPNNGTVVVGLATDSGLTVINLSTQKVTQYSDQTDNDYNAVVVTPSGRLYGLNEALGQAELWINIDFNENVATKVNGTPDKVWDEASSPLLSKSAPTIIAGAPDALEVVPNASLANAGVLATASVPSNSDEIFVGTDQGLTVIENHDTPAMGWSKFYTTTRQTPFMPAAIRRMHMMDDASGNVTNSAKASIMAAKGTPTYGVEGVRGKAMSFNGTSQYLCSDANSDGACDNDTTDNMNTGSWTISTWFKHSATITGTDVLFARCYNTTPAAAAGCVAASMPSSGVMTVNVDYDATFTIGVTGTTVFHTSVKTYNDNQWHFIAITRAATTGNINTQIDGIPIGQTAGLNTTLDAAQIFAIGNDCSVGAACATGANFWDGSIDDFEYNANGSTGTTDNLTVAALRRLYNDARPLLNKKAYSGAADTVTYTSTLITDSSTPGWIPQEFSGQIVTITSGTGINQTRRIVSNTASTITVSPALSTTPGNNDDFKIDPEALMGTTNSVTAIGVSRSSPMGEARMMCIGTNSSDTGGVTCFNHQAGPNLVESVYHIDGKILDDNGTEWTGANSDNIMSIDMTTRTAIFGTQTGFFVETQDVRLGNALDYFQNRLVDIKSQLLTLGSTTLAGQFGLEVGLSGGADLAEYYYSDEGLEAGTLVCVNTDKMGDNISATSQTYQNNMLGIVSTEPGAVLGENKPGGYPIALSGRVPLRVTTNGGKDPIKAGDYLTASSIPGVAMKANKAGFVIGMALEDFPPRPVLGVNSEANSQENSSEKPVATDSATLVGNGTQPKVSDEPKEDGKVLVFVTRTWFVPSKEQIMANTEAPVLTLDQDGNLIAPLTAGTKFIWKNSAGHVVAFVSDAGEALFSKVTAAFGDFGKLVFGEAVIKKDAKTAGQASFAANDIEVVIPSDKVKDDSVINLTPVSKTGGVHLYIKEIKAGESFTVGLERSSGDQPTDATASATTAIRFSWFLLNQE